MRLSHPPETEVDVVAASNGDVTDVRVVIVDDHDLFRRGLRELLEEQGIRVVGEAADGDEAVRLVAHATPDVVVMDLSLPRRSGVEAIRALGTAAPLTRVLVLTISADEATVMEAIMAGASGYLLKDATIAEIAAGVRAAAGGESLISPRIAAGLLERMRTGEVEEGVERAELSTRELEVLGLLAEGRDNEEIAATLVISPRTVKNHVSSILAKLQMENRIQAAVYAVRRGLV
jgi:DNA-binding NarL/FixJ family response regulator